MNNIGKFISIAFIILASLLTVVTFIDILFVTGLARTNVIDFAAGLFGVTFWLAYDELAAGFRDRFFGPKV